MKIFNTSQAAERLGVTVQRVHQLIQDGSLRAEKPGRDYIIYESDLASVTARRPVGRPPKAQAPAADEKRVRAKTRSGKRVTSSKGRRTKRRA